MTDKELKGLSRKELLEMLLRVSTENQELRDKLASAEEALRDRQINIDRAGTLAEAAFALNGVYESAQAACEQYVENIESLSKRQEMLCSEMEEESRRKSEAMLAETQARCDAMLEDARAQSQAYWNEVSEKLERFYDEHAGLRRLLDEMEPRRKQE